MCEGANRKEDLEQIRDVPEEVQSEEEEEEDSGTETPPPEEDDEDDYTIIRAKWIMDGANTLDEAIEKIQRYIEYLRELKEEGWELRRPIDDDYGFIYQDKPPSQDTDLLHP